MRGVLHVVIGLGLLMVVGLPALPARAHASMLCFPDVPGIESCISDRFLDFWWENGGLPVFGYPLTPVFQQQTPEGTFEVQYFERQRFEYHPEQAPPFDVQLGRLGDELLRKQGRAWPDEPVQPSVPPGCERFVITRQVVCPPFLSYWYAHGLASLRGHTRFGKALHLWGLPLTQPRQERNPDGDQVETQWFERARYEYHPALPPQHRILLGRLGAEALNGVAATIGGSLHSYDPAARVIRIASARDSSITTVYYDTATVIRCSDDGSLPADIFTRPNLKLSASGRFGFPFGLRAESITILCR